MFKRFLPTCCKITCRFLSKSTFSGNCNRGWISLFEVRYSTFSYCTTEQTTVSWLFRRRFSSALPESKFSGIQDHISALDTKRPKKKRAVREEEKRPGATSLVEQFMVTAFATAEEYNLDRLASALQKQGLYKLSTMPEDMHDVLHVTANYPVGDESREIYFFQEGAVVFWNVPELERNTVRKFLRDFEESSYEEIMIDKEVEEISYHYTDSGSKLASGKILLNNQGSHQLDKYAFSNALVLSVKLAIWEASLDRYVESIKFVTEDMKHGRKIRIDHKDILRKTGELFALRHLINLSSDLLDTPDFYWDRENLEAIYDKMSIHLNITRRTRVMNEKLNHCCELADLLKEHLSDKRHVRLEWIIILLIAVEVAIELSKWIPH